MTRVYALDCESSVVPLAGFDSDENGGKCEYRKCERIFIDGVFDLCHRGHFNALKEAKKLGTYLVVGINSDKEVQESKRARPILTEMERARIIASSKWVDEVIVGTPYSVTCSFLDIVNCEYAAHGDDIAQASDGTNAFADVLKAGRIKIFSRTRGVSTSAIIRKLLSASLRVFSPFSETRTSTQCNTPELTACVEETYSDQKSTCSSESDNYGHLSPQHACLSSLTMLEFLNSGEKKGNIDSNNAYILGAFDVLQPENIKLLADAHKRGLRVIVGIYDDSTCTSIMRSCEFPILSLMERAMNLLALNIVDEVLLGAPAEVDKEFLKTRNIVEYTRENYELKGANTNSTTGVLLKRIFDNRETLASSISTRLQRENNHWATPKTKI